MAEAVIGSGRGEREEIVLYQGNPLSINQAEWRRFSATCSHTKYWMFDRQRLKLEHMNRIDETGCDELALSSGRVLERGAAEGWDIFRLGYPEAASG
jgi:hypothetical protein